RDGLLQIMSASQEPGPRELAAKFVEGARVVRTENEVDLSLDMARLSGQSSLVATVTALSVRGVRLYAAWELIGEARDDVYFIARALADYAVHLRELRQPVRFPPSAPLVPDEIPYGKAVVPNPNAFAHPSWQEIHYSRDRPTFYACDFVTAKDGKSVV